MGKIGKERYIALPGKAGSSGFIPSKTSVPHFGKIVKSFIAIIQRGHDQLLRNILLLFFFYLFIFSFIFYAIVLAIHK